MAAFETVQARRAALLLHALPPAVRRQVVRKLDIAELARLKPLLDELAELGVSQSLGEQLHDVTLPAGPSALQPVPGATVEAVTLQEQVARLHAADVATCLRHCSPMTVAQLLRVRDWPWTAQVLGLMPEAQRVEVLNCTRSRRAHLAPGVLKALHERLCLRAAQLSSQRVESPIEHREIDGQQSMRQQIRSGLAKVVVWIR